MNLLHLKWALCNLILTRRLSRAKDCEPTSSRDVEENSWLFQDRLLLEMAFKVLLLVIRATMGTIGIGDA